MISLITVILSTTVWFVKIAFLGHQKRGSLSNFGVLKCLCTPGEDMH